MTREVWVSDDPPADDHCTCRDCDDCSGPGNNGKDD